MISEQVLHVLSFDGIPSTPRGLEDVSKMPDITRELVKRGYGKEDIVMILGGNQLRLIKDVVGYGWAFFLDKKCKMWMAPYRFH